MILLNYYHVSDIYYKKDNNIFLTVSKKVNLYYSNVIAINDFKMFYFPISKFRY